MGFRNGIISQTEANESSKYGAYRQGRGILVKLTLGEDKLLRTARGNFLRLTAKIVLIFQMFFIEMYKCTI